MRNRERMTRAIVLAAVISLPLLAVSGTATARPKRTATGSTAWCAHHPKRAAITPACTAGTGGGAASGTGTGGSQAITIQIDPDPVTETGPSMVLAVVQVEASPSFAGDMVDLSSSQFDQACSGLEGFTQAPFSTTSGSALHVPLVLDDDGNATTAIIGQDCAPGSDVFEASLEVAPFLTALGTLDVEPPAVTPTGVFGAPTTSGTVTTGEVETGDTTASGDSDVYAVFTVETDPVYAEQTVEINSAQLDARCLVSAAWVSLPREGSIDTIGFGGGSVFSSIPIPIDDDGNAAEIFVGRSCAVGPSTVIADVLAGTDPTYTTTFTVDPPAVTI